jgi:hypothetical protein
MPPWIMCDDAAEAPDPVVTLDEDHLDPLQGEVAERRGIPLILGRSITRALRAWGRSR